MIIKDDFSDEKFGVPQGKECLLMNIVIEIPEGVGIAEFGEAYYLEYEYITSCHKRVIEGMPILPNGEKVTNFLKRKHGDLLVRFLSKKEMEEYQQLNIENNRQILRDVERLYEKLMIKLTKQQSWGNLDYIRRRLLELLRILHDGIRRDEDFQQRAGLKEIADAIRRILHPERDGDFWPVHPKLKAVEKLVEELLEKISCLNFSENLLGVYLHKELEIGICVENIWEEAKKDERFFLDLTESVFAHEMAHCVHFHYVTQRQRRANNPYTNAKRSAVYETVAETVQWLHAVNSKQPQLINWMKDHMVAGSFPGWGYAGADILKQFADVFKVKSNTPDELLLSKIVELSKKDWKDAYAFIEFMKMLNVEMR